MAKWDHRLILKDIFHNEEITFEERRDRIVARMRKAPWFEPDTDGEIVDIAEAIELATSAPEFDKAWDWFYDWADYNRVWVATV